MTSRQSSNLSINMATTKHVQLKRALSALTVSGFLVAAIGLAGNVTNAASPVTATIGETIPSFAKDVKMTLNQKDQEITTLIEAFAKASGATFVVDPGVRGRVSLFTPSPVSLDDAFDLLSTSLALNGYSIVPQEGKYVVMASRNAQRSSIPTLTEITSVKPERYVTLIMNLKYVAVSDVNKRLRVLPSKDGEMTPFEETNQLFITDYMSNVSRIAAIIKQIDQPVSPGLSKLIKDAKAKDAVDRAQWQARQKGEAKTEHFLPESMSQPQGAPAAAGHGKPAQTK